MQIELTEGLDNKDEILNLFAEYTALLTNLETRFSKYLEIQHYDDEIKHLEAKYSRPYGRLYLCKVDGKSAGCIALRKLSDSKCEMKRLFIRPEFRGLHIGSILVDHVIADAREIGYREMYLDTIPQFRSAIEIYKSRGFEETARYNDSPEELPTLFFIKML